MRKLYAKRFMRTNSCFGARWRIFMLGEPRVKVIVRLLVAVVVTISCLASAQAQVYFADPSLKTVVEEELGVSDPTPIDMLALRTLDSKQGQIFDLTGLEYATNLYMLILSDNQVGNISALAGRTNVRILYLDHNLINDISALSELTDLTGLYLHDNQINDISVLSRLVRLRFLYLGMNQISDITALSRFVSLTWLALNVNQIDDISALSELTNLQYLYLNKNQIRDISALSRLTNLTWLPLDRNLISNIASLTGLMNLTYLDLRQNPLDANAYNIYIPQILANNPGIMLFYDTPIWQTLSISFSAGGYVTKPGEGSFQFVYEEVIQVEATEGANHQFAGWTGTAVDAGRVVDPDSATTWVTMDADYTLHANFLKDQWTLTISSTKGGSVTKPGEGQFQYIHGEVVQVEAANEENHQFVNWTGTAVDARRVAYPYSATTAVMMDTDYSIQANFVEVPVHFDDLNLKAAVEESLGISDPNATDMLALTRLYAEGRGIVDLTGLEYALNLTELRLAGNKISDISPLSGLRKLKRLYLEDNSISDISPISELSDLQWLDLADNRISDIPSALKLSRLKNLDLRGNRLSTDAYNEIQRIVKNNPGMTIRHDERTRYTLKVSSTKGGSVTTPGQGSFHYYSKKVVPIKAKTDKNYSFVEWTGTAVEAGKVTDPNSASTKVTVDADYTLKVHFVKDRCTLSTSSTNGGSVTKPGQGPFEYDQGTVVPIKAEAEMNCHFVKWTGAAVDAGRVADPRSPSTKVTVDADYMLKAHFVRDRCTLATSSTNGGSVTKPGQGPFAYDQGTAVLIKAQAEKDYHFVKWTGTAVNAGKVVDPNSISTAVRVDADYTLRANFAADRYEIAVRCGPNGSVRPRGDINMAHGGDLKIEATPHDSYRVARWLLDGRVIQTKRNIYTLRDIRSNHKVRVTFAPARTIIYVDDDAVVDPGPNDSAISDPCEDGSIEHPFDTIQEAVDVAAEGHTVTVLEGRYYESINFGGKNITLTGADPNSLKVVASTIIDGNGVDTVVNFVAGEDANCVLTGLTVKNGNAQRGGGIYCYNSSPTISKCVVSANVANSGGGIANWHGNPKLINCIFSRNRAKYGGAVFNAASNPTLAKCCLRGNRAAKGGGIYNTKSNPIVTNCLLSGNLANGNGGGMYCENSRGTFGSCTFAENSGLNGNALAFDSFEQKYLSNVRLINCILWNGGNEIWNNDRSQIALAYSNVRRHRPDEGNIPADPCFIKPGHWDPNGTPEDPNDDFWIDGDYRLNPCSPCINRGDPNYICGPNEIDLDGNPRMIGGRIDMGAFEYTFIYDKPHEGAYPRSWWKYSENPVFSVGDSGEWDNRLNGCIAALKDREEPVAKYNMSYVGGNQFIEGTELKGVRPEWH